MLFKTNAFYFFYFIASRTRPSFLFVTCFVPFPARIFGLQSFYIFSRLFCFFSFRFSRSSWWCVRNNYRRFVWNRSKKIRSLSMDVWSNSSFSFRSHWNRSSNCFDFYAIFAESAFDCYRCRSSIRCCYSTRVIIKFYSSNAFRYYQRVFRELRFFSNRKNNWWRPWNCLRKRNRAVNCNTYRPLLDLLRKKPAIRLTSYDLMRLLCVMESILLRIYAKKREDS